MSHPSISSFWQLTKAHRGREEERRAQIEEGITISGQGLDTFQQVQGSQQQQQVPQDDIGAFPEEHSFAEQGNFMGPEADTFREQEPLGDDETFAEYYDTYPQDLESAQQYFPENEDFPEDLENVQQYFPEEDYPEGEDLESAQQYFPEHEPFPGEEDLEGAQRYFPEGTQQIFAGYG